MRTAQKLPAQQRYLEMTKMLSHPAQKRRLYMLGPSNPFSCPKCAAISLCLRECAVSHIPFSSTKCTCIVHYDQSMSESTPAAGSALLRRRPRLRGCEADR